MKRKVSLKPRRRGAPEEARPTAPPTPKPSYLRDTAPNWLEIGGEAVFSRGPTLRIPVRFAMNSVDWLVPAMIEVKADAEVLERAFINGAFEGRMVRLEVCETDFRTSVKALNKETGSLWLDAAPLYRALARALAVRLRPPFFSPSPHQL
jgi:hypothetical protein